MPYELDDYLRLSIGDVEAQWREVCARRPHAPDAQKTRYLPVETLLCAAAMLVMDLQSYGGSAAPRAPSPVPELAAIFRRPPSSILIKMANLDGSRRKGGKNDIALWRTLSANPDLLFDLYRLVLAGARRLEIDDAALPDFLGLEHSEHFMLLGQDELDGSAIEELLKRTYEDYVDAAEDPPSERETIQRERIGQHRFARSVLANCGWECVFCGFSLGVDPRRPLLRASHIKPWRACSSGERRDVRNGVAACPTHDAAFDAGELTLKSDLTIALSRRLRSTDNRAVRAVFEPPLLRQRAWIPAGHALPYVEYLSWHGERVFVG